MLNALRANGERMFANAMEANIVAINRLLARAPGAVMLDVGCDDGLRSLRFAAAARATEVHGVEIASEAANRAAERGLIVTSFDLCEPWPYPDGFFDVICSNQVIEHLRDTDMFVRETKRCLRPGGSTVVSTENLASWHNIASLVFGWQPFSLTNVSDTVAGLGNPFALHADGKPEGGTSWQHLRVFAYAGLVDLYEQHGLAVDDVVGSGYYPLPSATARFDARHAAFLAMIAHKS